MGRFVLLPVALLAALACSVACGTGRTMRVEPTPTAGDTPHRAALAERLAAIDRAVSAWQAASDLPAARRAAEEARNLVVGADGPSYGDSDGDGTVRGAGAAGLLPGLTGVAGLAAEEDGACVVRDVLGGSWADPAARWAELDARIAAWAPANNTFPALPSHPQRIVGWATLALRARSLDEAVEYAGHARLHVDVSVRALTDCR
ncbi:MAG: hypothetical protein AB7G21_05525 [Dehalococcoidia bacterium]